MFCVHSSLGCTCFASLDLALGALVDVPMRSGVAQIAIPKDERGIRFDHLEVVLALSWLCHCFETLVSLCLRRNGLALPYQLNVGDLSVCLKYNDAISPQSGCP